MHCVILADLAATIAKHSSCFWESEAELPSETMMRYWTASRSRHELWHRVMARYRTARNEDDYFALRKWWSDHHVVLQEVIVSDVLARIVASIGAQAFKLGHRSANRAYENFAAITHGVFLSQVEASNRVSRIILESSGASIRDVVRLNRLRLGVQRWSDWLVGSSAMDLECVSVYCIDRERTAAFHSEARECAAEPYQSATRWLMTSAMHEMLVQRTSPQVGLAQANYEVASAAMSLFQSRLFDSYGLPKSAWLHRLDRAAPSKITISASGPLPMAD